MPNVPAPSDHIANRILVIRGHKVMLDTDLAKLYGVPTKRLNEQVKRNATRFPADFLKRADGVIWMLTIYAKNEVQDISCESPPKNQEGNRWLRPSAMSVAKSWRAFSS